MLPLCQYGFQLLEVAAAFDQSTGLLGRLGNELIQIIRLALDDLAIDIAPVKLVVEQTFVVTLRCVITVAYDHVNWLHNAAVNWNHVIEIQHANKLAIPIQNARIASLVPLCKTVPAMVDIVFQS